MMRAAVSMIEQCKELARRRQHLTADTIAAFCVVSPEVAGELLQKLIALGVVTRSPGRAKKYR